MAVAVSVTDDGPFCSDDGVLATADAVSLSG